MARPAQQPTLETDRLRLRPFSLADAPMVKALAGTVEVASTTPTLYALLAADRIGPDQA